MVWGMNKSVPAEISKLSGSFFVPVVYPIYIYLSLQILCKTVMAREIEFTDKSCTRKLSRCQLERCQCHTLVCCIIIAAFLPTEVKIISIVSAFTVKINKMYKN